MIARCYNSNDKAYSYYGGRGIKICPEWKNSFTQFYKDMDHPPPGFEIDRIDNDGNYEPGNCRWTTREENMRNTKHTKCTPEIVRFIRSVYPKIAVAKLADIYGTHINTIYRILNKETWKNIA